MSEFPQACSRTNLRGRGGYRGPFRGGRPSHRGGMGGAHPQRDYRYSTETTCGYCGSWPHRAGRNAKLWAKSAITVVDLDIFKSMQAKVRLSKYEKTTVKHIDMEEQPQTTFRVSTPPHISSQMSKRKSQSNA